MRSWKHSGYSVRCGKPIKACDADGHKTLSEYISRAPFSLERMSFNQDSKTSVYRGEHFHPTIAWNFDVKPLAVDSSHNIPYTKEGSKAGYLLRGVQQGIEGERTPPGYILPKKPTELETDTLKKSVHHAPATEDRCGLCF